MSDAPKPEAQETPSPPLRSVHTTSFPPILDRVGHLGPRHHLPGRQAGDAPPRRRASSTPTSAASASRWAWPAMATGWPIGTALEIWEYHNAPAVARRLEPEGRHDACFLPRAGHCTGDVQIHEMAWGPAIELWFVNTRFSCLCTLDRIHSFVPRWRPPFITELAPEDRCHLNGMCLVEGRPAFVTALGESDTQRRLARAQEGRRRPDRGRDRPGAACAACRCPTRRAGTTASCGCWTRAPAGSATSTPGRGATGAWPNCPASPAGSTSSATWPSSASRRCARAPSSAASPSPSGRSRSAVAASGCWTSSTGQTVAFVKFEDAVQEIFAVQALPGVRFPDVINDDRALLCRFVRAARRGAGHRACAAPVPRLPRP